MKTVKTLLKVLTPTIPTIGIATIALTSCGPKGDGYVAVPSELLKIEDSILKGFEDPTVAHKDYTKITVPKSVETVMLSWSEHDIAYDSIKKIDYESDSNWKSIITISSLPSLEILVLPPKLNSIDDHAVMNCNKLNTIDISNVEDLTCLSSTEWIYINGSGVYDSGTLIIKHSQADKVQAIKTKNPCLEKFEVKEI